MKELKILCWNVNGIRAVVKRGFWDFLYKQSPDILSVQETRAQQEQLDADMLEPSGYHAYWNFPERKGYSGVATFTKEKPLKIENGFGIEEFDVEGRVIITEYSGFTLLNIYFPNGKKDDIRLKYKMDFYESFLLFANRLREQGKKLVVCGDYNTAHKEIDIARPKENEKRSGFLPMERAWIDKFISHGYVDIFRRFNEEPNQYTWWDLKTGARDRNIGWRIDYFFVTEDLAESVTQAVIMPEIMGSDHCPIGIILKTS